MKNKSNFALDNTLRFLYCIVQLHGGTLMAIRFKHRGKEYSVDTPDEAISLARKLEQEDEADVRLGNISEEELVYENTRWSEDRFLSMTENIGIAQQKFLAVLLDSLRGPVNVDTIAKKLGVHSAMALAGVQSGLAKQLRAIGLEPIDLYRVEISWTDGERRRFLTLNEGFRLAALDAGWPPEHIRKALKEVKK